MHACCLRYTKHLKPSDISLSFLSGKGHLSNLELNGDVLSEALQLPPWLVISKVICDTIRARVPFTSINTDPVNFVSCHHSSSVATNLTFCHASWLMVGHLVRCHCGWVVRRMSIKQKCDVLV